MDPKRFERAIAAIDRANGEDPISVSFGGERRPKERVHAERASHWLERLDPAAGELLRLAVRAHHLRRWQLPRADYPEGRAGYHAWRRELQRRHAQEAGALLAEAGYSAEETARVGELIAKRGLGRDPEVQHFEDTLCLVFLELQLEDFASAHAPEQVVDILAKTLRKMSEGARRIAAEISSTPRVHTLLGEAVARFRAAESKA